MSEAVLYSVEEGVAQVRLNRPDAYNAIDSTIIQGLLAAGRAIREDSGVRVVVLSGMGKGFCSGLDMANFGDMASGNLTADSAAHAYADLSLAGANMVQQLGWQWQELDIPVIAALRGAAMGGGLNLAYGLVTRLSDDPLQDALELARTIASRNPDAVRRGKRLLNDLPHMSVREGLIAESNASRDMPGTANQLEAVSATLEGRAPSYS